MDLINLLPQKRNTTVTVNGTTYQIDPNGVCRGVKAPDAAKMLQNTEAWQEWNGQSPKKSGTTLKAGIGLIGADGSILRKTEASPSELPPQAASTPAGVSLADEVTAVPGADTDSKWGEPADGEDWPDPTEAMPLSYLQKMADAYVVRYTKKTTVPELVAKIMREMYPEE